MEILSNPAQRVPLETLLKCEKALEKMEIVSYSGQQFGVYNFKYKHNFVLTWYSLFLPVEIIKSFNGSHKYNFTKSYCQSYIAQNISSKLGTSFWHWYLVNKLIYINNNKFFNAPYFFSVPLLQLKSPEWLKTLWIIMI